MDIRRLQAFARIVDIGSITRASAILHIAQPALSQQIASLEAHFGKELLVRSKRGVVPTEAGKVLYRHCQIILKQVEQAELEIAASGESISGFVSVGVAPLSLGTLVAAQLMKAIRDEYPAIVLHINENVGGGVISELIMAGKLDIALIYDPGGIPGVSFEPVQTEELYLVSATPIERLEQGDREITLTDALARSLNIPAVKVFERVGREAVANIASDFGIESDLAVGPALALGTSESTLLEMTGAYAGILNGGSSVEPYGLVELMLKGDDEPLLTQEGGIVERVVTESAARQLIYMMSQVIERGTGTRAQLPGRPAAGKSGTTQAARDAWFIGFTADYVTGVWMGYDDNTPLTGVTGGGLPAEVWKETMLRIHEGVPVRPLPMIAPEPSSQVATERSQRNRTGENAVDRVILNVLNEIFGLR